MLSPGVLTAHDPYHLMLLGSPPDMVREGSLRKAQTSTHRRHDGCTDATLKTGIHPCYSGFQVQDTANVPTGVILLQTARIGAPKRFSFNFDRKGAAPLFLRICDYPKKYTAFLLFYYYNTAFAKKQQLFCGESTVTTPFSRSFFSAPKSEFFGSAFLCSCVIKLAGRQVLSTGDRRNKEYCERQRARRLCFKETRKVEDYSPR